MQTHTSIRCAAIVALLLVTLSSPAAERRRGEGDREPARERDPRMNESEDGCLDGRVLDYLARHGDNGIIDPQLLLDTTREMKNELERERRGPKTLSIG